MRRILCLLVPVAVAALVLVGCGNEEPLDDNAFGMDAFADGVAVYHRA